jgi:hypothetical protein
MATVLGRNVHWRLTVCWLLAAVAHCQPAGVYVDGVSCVTNSSVYCRVPSTAYPFTCKYSYYSSSRVCRNAAAGGCDVAGLLTSWKDRAHTMLDDMCGVIGGEAPAP